MFTLASLNSNKRKRMRNLCKVWGGGDYIFLKLNFIEYLVSLEEIRKITPKYKEKKKQYFFKYKNR